MSTMTMMIAPSFLLWPILNVYTTHILLYACQCILCLSAIFAVAWYCGWIHRLIWHLAESELSKAALNQGACKLTIGALEYDLIRGRVWASNVIVHSPNRAAWHWASPVIARVGKVYVETNLVYVLLSMCFLFEEPPLEVYTLHVSDVQCFLERKHNVFNIHLLDPRNVIPDPSTFAVDNDHETSSTRDSIMSVDHTAGMDESMDQQTFQQVAEQDKSPTRREIADQDGAAAGGSLDVVFAENDHAEQQQQQQQRENTAEHNADTAADAADKEDEITAQRLVNDMISAVESLGQAVQQHGSLPRAWNEQRQQIAQRLKQMVAKGSGHQQDDSVKNSSNPDSPTRNTTSTTTATTNASKAMKQGVRLVQHVSKAVVEKTQSVQKVVLPPRRAPRKNQKIVYARFGRVVIDDVRVFTRNYKSNRTTSSSSSKLLAQQLQQQQQHQQRIQQQQQQSASSPPSSPERVIVGTMTEPQSSPTTPAIPSSSQQEDAQSSAATPTTSLTTRTATSVSSSTMKESLSTSSATAAASTASAAATLLQYSSVTSAWNKPIVVRRCAVRASEFCPPLNAKEGDDMFSPALPYSNGHFVGFPVLYQPIEKCMDAILKRVVADMAKANNGRIFQTALGEVLDYWSTLENNNNADSRNSGGSTSERVD